MGVAQDVVVAVYSAYATLPFPAMPPADGAYAPNAVIQHTGEHEVGSDPDAVETPVESELGSHAGDESPHHLASEAEDADPAPLPPPDRRELLRR